MLGRSKAATIIIYSRYSSDMQRKDSCDDQIRKVREGLSRMGINSSNAIVLRDEEVSGTKESRAGFDKIKTMIDKKQPFTLVTDDQSRLSRGDNVKSLVRDLVFAGGRFISIGEAVDTDQPGWEIKVGIMELHNSLAINEIARRVRRGQEGRVLDQNGSAGDYCYGFTSKYADPNWAGYDGRGLRVDAGIVGIDAGDLIRVRARPGVFVHLAFAHAHEGWLPGQSLLLGEVGVPGVPLLAWRLPARIGRNERNVKTSPQQFHLGLGLVIPITALPRPRIARRRFGLVKGVTARVSSSITKS